MPRRFLHKQKVVRNSGSLCASGKFLEQVFLGSGKYQTPFNALKPGDYVRCVEDQFKVKLALGTVPEMLFVAIVFEICLFTSSRKTV